ncbi:unnamed protein product [Alternaria alternata]
MKNNAISKPCSPQSPADATVPSAGQPIVDVPPNGGYGWVCVAAVATINGHTWGLNSAYAVFLAHYLSTSAFPGATPLQYAFIGGLSISQALIVSPVATLTTRRWGTRTTLFIGVGFETSGGWYGGRDVLGDGCASYDGGYGAERLAECVEYYLVGTCVAYYL